MRTILVLPFWSYLAGFGATLGILMAALGQLEGTETPPKWGWFWSVCAIGAVLVMAVTMVCFGVHVYHTVIRPKLDSWKARKRFDRFKVSPKQQIDFLDERIRAAMLLEEGHVDSPEQFFESTLEKAKFELSALTYSKLCDAVAKCKSSSSDDALSVAVARFETLKRELKSQR